VILRLAVGSAAAEQAGSRIKTTVFAPEMSKKLRTKKLPCKTSKT
jgi:hypothetical protein